MSVKLDSLSVFLPCYNEARNIDKVIEQAYTYLPTIACDFEIIIVDDGSTDDTKERVTRLQSKYPKVRVISIVRAQLRAYGQN